MAQDVTVGLPMAFPVGAVADFLLRQEVVEHWMGHGARLTEELGSAVTVPPGTIGSVHEVRRTASSFVLRVLWQDSQDDGFTVRVTTRPEGRSRVRVIETGVLPEKVDERVRFWSQALSRLGALVGEASAQRRHYRQAVVVVHGIGEQRPTVTLRNFVEAVFPDRRGQKRFMKPDYVSPLVGATSVTVPGKWSQNRPTTDVYELYWAHLLRDTTAGQVYSWALRLLLAPRANITRKLRPHVYTLRALGLLIGLAAVALGVAYVLGGSPRGWVTASVTAAVALYAVVPGVIWKVGKLFGSPLQNLLVVNILGDAARYLDPSPANVAVRQTIRETGLQLLDDLHDRGRYHRIVVYGHSLGTVVAYDILDHAWTRRSRSHQGAKTMATPHLRAVEDLLNPRSPDAPLPGDEAVRAAQNAAWREYVGNGFNWLVSDFVTAGSPLTHGRWLLNPDPASTFDDLVAERSLPTAPPQTQSSPTPTPGRTRRTFTFTHLYRSADDERARSVLVPDHGAPFSLVRWTNLYFPHEGVMKGDPVGGPLHDTFGHWITDIPLPHPGGGVGGFAHTKYVDTSQGHVHVDELRRALDLTVESPIAAWLGRPVDPTY